MNALYAWLDERLFKSWHHVAQVVILVLFVYAVVKVLNRPADGWMAGATVLGVIAGLMGTQYVSTGYVHMRKETSRPRPSEPEPTTSGG